MIKRRSGGGFRELGEWWSLGEALGFPLVGGPAHRLYARPQVPFIVPLTEASAQLRGNVLFRAIKQCSLISMRNTGGTPF